MSANGSNTEPSMDEILASIRKIIEDEPAAAAPPLAAEKPTSATAVETAAPASAPQQANAPATAAGPLKRRLSETLHNLADKTAPSTAHATDLGADSSGSIDDDLADLLDEPMPRVAQRASRSSTASTHTAAPTADSSQPSPGQTTRESFFAKDKETSEQAGEAKPSTAASAAAASAPSAQPAPAARPSLIPATARPVASMEPTPAATDPFKAVVAQEPEATANTASDQAANAFTHESDPPAALRPGRSRPWDLGAVKAGEEKEQTAQHANPVPANPSHPASRINFNAIVPARPDVDTGADFSKNDATSSPSAFDAVPSREADTTDEATSDSFGAAERALKPAPTLSFGRTEPAKSEDAATPSLEATELTLPDTDTNAAKPGETEATSDAAQTDSFAGFGALPTLSSQPAQTSLAGASPTSPEQRASSDAPSLDKKRANSAPAELKKVEDVSAAKAEQASGASADTTSADPADVEPSAQASGSKTSLNDALERATGLKPAERADETTQAAATSDSADRTLDETAAELLRPLVREWLDKNMPRIFERALQIEMAQSVKDQLGGPRTDADATPATPGADKPQKH